MYDYLIVGAGLYGAVFARQAADAGKRGNSFLFTLKGPLEEKRLQYME